MLQSTDLTGEVRVDPSLSDFIQDYCSSEYFYFLGTQIKEHAERILAFWCDETGYDPSLPIIEHALQKTALLKFDLETKRCVPQLIKEFYTFLSRSGKIPQADTWIAGISACESEYQTGFREDGTVRGTTHVKKYSDVGRNEPCPCGSGKKFKKCCMGLIG